MTAAASSSDPEEDNHDSSDRVGNHNNDKDKDKDKDKDDDDMTVASGDPSAVAPTSTTAASSPASPSSPPPETHERAADEEDYVDPFYHRLNLSPAQWVRTVVLTVVLLPVRVALVLSCVVSAWALCMLAMAGLTEEDLATRPLTGWRRALRTASMFLGRRCCNAAGFQWVRVKGRRASPEEAPVLVVAPHSTFFDGLAVFWSGGPYLVSRTENRAIPFLGRCIECAQALFVSREDPDSRQKTVKEILRRSAVSSSSREEEGTSWPQLIIFPEGSTANRKALMTFKPGAFYPARPVQPVLIRYPNKLDTVTWTWNQPHGAIKVMWLTLSQPFTRVELEFLPVYQPSDEEKDDAKLFARNVRHVMAAALGVPTSDVTFEEIKAKFGKNKKKAKAE